MRIASAFSPGHLTGFFQICDEPDDPLLKGARGSGCSIALGVQTRVEADPASRTSTSISINGRETSEALVSEAVVRRMLSPLGKPFEIRVYHESQIPIGAGFGASGGGALSLALALNEALGVGLSRIEAAQVAHVAEIECRTGLGTVIAELNGGFGVLVKPGGPGIGETVRFRHSGLSVVGLHFGPISTRVALSDPALRRRVNELGGKFVDELYRDQDPSLFMQLSRRFAEYVGLITPRLRMVLGRTDDAGIPCTMTMFGETIFSLVADDVVDELLQVLRAGVHEHKPFVTGIDEQGARLI